MRTLPGLVLLAATLAGCLGGDDGPTSFAADWSQRALAFGPGHDHEDRAQHRGLSTPNFEVVGYDPLVSPHYGAPAGAYFCGDAQDVEDGRRIAAVESRSDVGFALADVTDPARPTWLGELVMSTTRIYDLAVVPDGRHVALVTSEIEDAALEPATGLYDGIHWRSPCAAGPVPLRWAAQQEDDPVPRPMSLILVSIEDPAQPVIIDQHPIAGNGHSVFATIIDGATWLMVTTTRLPTAIVSDTTGVPLALPLSQNEVSAYEFYQIADERLRPISAWKPPPDETSTQRLGPRGHDGWLAAHPVDGRLLAYAVGHERFTILDMSDPSNPAEIGRWVERGVLPDESCCELHSVYPLPELWNDRHYTILGPEYADHPGLLPSGVVWVLDTTDATAPREVAAWTLPHDVAWSGDFMFSNHYFSVIGRTLFISMYHGGIWAVDLAPVGTEDLALLPSIGVYLPDIDPPQEIAYTDRWAPTVEEALGFADGSIVTFDGNSGLYVLRFDETRPAPPPEPWPLDLG